MKVVRVARFGGPDVLVVAEAPDPVAGVGEVLVDVSVADTLHVDTVIRRGAFPFPVVRPPYVPGGGVAGEVVSVGDGVDAGRLGRRVVARTGAGELPAEVVTVAQRARTDSHAGGYAERAVVPAGALVPVPAAVDMPDAAALVNDGMTAMLLLEAVRPRRGEWVLVTPAAGGVGNLLVQLAHAAGAHVVGAARGERKLDRAREAGAEATVDYTRDGWAGEIRALTGGRGPGVVLDGVGGEVGRVSLELTAPGGRFVGYGAPSGEFTHADRQGVTATSLLDLPIQPGGERRLTELVLAAVAAGHVAPLIGQTFPLARAADAHTAIETREAIGKTLLIP